MLIQSLQSASAQTREVKEEERRGEDGDGSGLGLELGSDREMKEVTGWEAGHFDSIAAQLSRGERSC